MDLDTSFGGSDAPVQEPTESVAEPTVQNAEIVEDLTDPFLKNIPAQHRDIVAQYVKQWNSGAQKKFREYQGRIKPYEELGSLEELQGYRTLAMNIRSNPEAVFRIMYQGLEEQYGDQFPDELARIVGMQMEAAMADEYDGGYHDDSGQPDQDEVWRGNVENELNEFREWREAQEQARVEQQEFAALDEFMGQMHNAFGDFDDTYVLTRLADGRTPQQAFQDWQAMGTKYFANGASRQAPKVMGGQGGVPNGIVDASQLRGKNRKEAVQAMLAGLPQRHE